MSRSAIIISKGVSLMEDKIFELISKMYSDMNSNLDEINKKLDMKADKNDVVRIEDKLENS